MKKTKKNLALIRATVRPLTAAELETTGGGGTPRTTMTWITCTCTCETMCTTRA